jgi:hypothetical protein
VALMTIKPPDLVGANAAARIARAAGVNGSETLLKEIDNRSRVV